MMMRLLLLAAETAAEPSAQETAGGWAAWLQEYGGWGISVILAGVVVYLWFELKAAYVKEKPPSPEQLRDAREAQEARDKALYDQVHKDLLDKLHDTLVPLVEAISDNTTATTDLTTEAKVLFEDVIKKKDEVITELARQKDEVGKEAMAKMEALYKDMLGLVERVIGAAGTLKDYADVLEQIKTMQAAQGDTGDSA